MNMNSVAPEGGKGPAAPENRVKRYGGVPAPHGAHPMTCPSCGREVRSVARDAYCHDCGGRFSDLAKPPAEPDAPLPFDREDTRSRIVIFPWGLLVSVNDRKGGMVGKLSEKYRTRLAAMRKQAKEDLAHLAPLSGPVSMAVTYHPPDRRKRDCHNYDKAIADALIGSAYVDDEQIIEWRGRKMPKSESPRAEVEVAPLLEVA